MRPCLRFLDHVTIGQKTESGQRLDLILGYFDGVARPNPLPVNADHGSAMGHDSLHYRGPRCASTGHQPLLGGVQTFAARQALTRLGITSGELCINRMRWAGSFSTQVLGA